MRYESGTTPIDDTYTGQFACTLQSYNDLIWLYITPYFISGIPKYAIISIRKIFDSVFYDYGTTSDNPGYCHFRDRFWACGLEFYF